jgi:hypothetical protein
MTDTEPSSSGATLYRFSRPGDVEIETQELPSDDAAEVHARELSKTQDTSVIIKRHNRFDWEYVIEVDERD